jgi:hypothetical protein
MAIPESAALIEIARRSIGPSGRPRGYDLGVSDIARGDNIGEPPSPYDELGWLRLECWYCSEEIEYSGFDPCAVIIVTNWDDEEKQSSQQFFAHGECFRRSGSGTNLYVFEADSEPGE